MRKLDKSRDEPVPDQLNLHQGCFYLQCSMAQVRTGTKSPVKAENTLTGGQSVAG